MKCLSYSPEHRSKDYDDLQGLIKIATEEELQYVEGLLQLIVQRGYSRGRDLIVMYRDLLKKHS